MSGNANLRKAIAADLWSRKHVRYSPDEVVVSNGAKQAVLQAMMAVVSPGDQVIIPAPYWTSYPGALLLHHSPFTLLLLMYRPSLTLLIIIMY